MGEGWSLGRRDLIPSNGPVTHFDLRMHWQIGTGDIDPCMPNRDRRKPRPLALSELAGRHATHSQDYLTAPPREPSERELGLVALRMTRDVLLDRIDSAIDEVAAALRRGAKP
jgi:hypothetical protein